MKKKVISALLASTMIVSLVACGSTGGDTGGSETTAYPKWSELEDNHVFNVGDYFTDYGKTYHVLRQFQKISSYRPPALSGDFYEEVTA